MPPGGRLGDKAQVPLDAHGCPACPHPGTGPAIAGSPDVNINKRPALRLNDPGLHAACCATNTWNAVQGSATVFINGKAAVRMGDQTKHCGGLGKVIEGSPNVDIGGSTTAASTGSPSRTPSGGGTPGGSGGGATGSASGRSGGSSAPEATGGNASSGASGGGASAAQTAGNAQASPQVSPEPDKFTLWIKPDAIHGGTLAGETVAIVDPATRVVVAEVEVGADGNLLASVPENKPYDLVILGQTHVIPGDGIDVAALVTSHLHVVVHDAQGEPIPEGVEVMVRGMGIEQSVFTAADGSISPHVPEGLYELEVDGQTFPVHTHRQYDLDHEGGAPFALQLVPRGDEPDYESLEAGRVNRVTGADLNEG